MASHHGKDTIDTSDTAQKMKFSIKDFFSKCVHIRRKLWIWSHLMKKSLMENLFFVQCQQKFWKDFPSITSKVALNNLL